MENNKTNTFGVCVKDIFEKYSFTIPIYQRNYAWENGHREQLIADILSIKKSDNTYYLGSLVVKKTNGFLEVIDGQQRLTTLFLIYSFLKAEFREEATSISIDPDNFMFQSRELSNKCIKQLFSCIEKSDNINEENGNELILGYKDIKRIFNNIKTQSVDFKDKTKKELVEDFIKKLDQVHLIVTHVPEDEDLNHYFEIMNTRGEQLEPHEIVKSYIMKALKENENENNIQLASVIWDACASMDSYLQMNFSKDLREKIFGEKWDDLLPQDKSALFKIDSQSSGLNTKTLKEIFSIQEKELIKEDKSTEENERFESIINFQNFLLHVNILTQNKNKELTSDEESSLDDKTFIKKFNNYKGNKELSKSFIYNLLKLRFLFDKYIIKREFKKDYKNEGRWSLQMLTKNDGKPLYKGTFSQEGNNILRNLQSCLRITYTSPKTMHWITIALETAESIFKNFKDSNDLNFRLINQLEKYACKKITDSKYESKSGFDIERIVFTFLDYILWKKAKILNDKNLSEMLKKFPDNIDFVFRTSIEHFYPQNPIDRNKNWEEDDLNGIGNLALVTVSANSAASNSIPSQKVVIYEKKGVEIVNKSPKLFLMCQDAEKWDKNKAQEHGKEMKEILAKYIEELQTISKSNNHSR